jgi:hypothetical protein
LFSYGLWLKVGAAAASGRDKVHRVSASPGGGAEVPGRISVLDAQFGSVTHMGGGESDHQQLIHHLLEGGGVELR